MRILLSFLFSCLTLVAGLEAGQPPQAEPGPRTEEQALARVLVAYHSRTGNTESMAKAVAEGVGAVDGVVVTIKAVGEVSEQDILQADGILLGTPVHWGSLAVPAKDFLDRVGEVLDNQTHGEGRTAGAFCTGGAVSSGKELARLAILAAFMNLRFVVVGGLAADGFGNLGAQATTGPEDPGISATELDEARRSGERFARITKQYKEGRSH